jgi:hypothetical protein
LSDNGDKLRALFLDRLAGRERYGVRIIIGDDERYEPVQSTRDATLWLCRYHPERLADWLSKHEPQLRLWLDKQPMPEPKVLLW